MDRTTTEHLGTISDLAAAVAKALEADFSGVDNGRVRDVPDLRAIRYYTTLGLLDRPAEMRGRVAYYGRRHLLQLVAIKRLQARGLSLAQVQEQLLGQSDRGLEQLAAIRTDVWPGASEPAGDQSRHSAKRSRELDFWAAAPERTSVESDEEAGQPAATPEMLTLIPVGPGLRLGISADRPMTADDIAALHAAAEPLRQVLVQRRLVRPDSE